MTLQPGTDLTARLAVDAQSVEALRAQAKNDPDRALKATARQFEALFMNMLLKSMREASPQDGLFDNEQTRLYTAMLDQQLAQTMAGRGIGLADVMVRQLAQAGLAPGSASEAAGMGATAPATPAAATPLSATPPGAPVEAAPRSPGVRGADAVQDFMTRHADGARAAAGATGIPERFLLAQAGLESGWGKRQLRGLDGSESNNLFGIKAGRGWTGRVVEAWTTEYVDGKPVKSVERFRAYDTPADSFRDYAQLIANSPRYAGVRDRRDEVAFAYGLQRAGYATDPQYADKLLRVIDTIKSRVSTTA